MTTETMPLGAPRSRRAMTALAKTYDVSTSIMAVVVAVIGVLALVVAVLTRMAPDQQYTIFGHPVLTVLSGSMSPAIKTGDLIVDKPIRSSSAAANLHVGQIITFRDPSAQTMVLTHRIESVQKSAGLTLYVTKGDANNAPDMTPVPSSNVIGVFDHKVPRGGYVLAALHRPLVLGLLILSPVLWFVSGPLIAYGRKRDDEEVAER